jgi:hypothetical protein
MYILIKWIRHCAQGEIAGIVQRNVGKRLGNVIDAEGLPGTLGLLYETLNGLFTGKIPGVID